MEALGAMGAGAVPIYRRDRSGKTWSAPTEKSSKKRSKSKKRAAPPANTATPRASTSDGGRQVQPSKGSLADLHFPSATASTVSLPPAPPTPPLTPHTPNRLLRQDRAGSLWDDARRGRAPSRPSGGSGAEAEKGINQGVGETGGASRKGGAGGGSQDFEHHHPHHPPRQHPRRNQSLATSPPVAAGTASRPDPPLGDHNARPRTPHQPVAAAPSPPRNRPELTRSATTPLQPRPQRPKVAIPPSARNLHSNSPPPVLRPSDANIQKPRIMAPTTSGTTYTSTSGVGTATFNPTSTFQHIQDMSAKRISTLDYLRKTHEGRVYWFNTLLYSRPDILRLPSFQPTRLGRRAAHLLMLGLSLPAALDGVATSPMDYLRALNALMSEFEQYQTIHPVEGGTNTSGSFGRGKLPQMFKRNQGIKNRRASTAADIGLPMAAADAAADGGADAMSSSTGTLGGGGGGGGSATPASGNAPPASATASGYGSNGPQSLPPPSGATSTISLPQPDAATLLPGEEYTLLLTPSLPFEPDFFEVFATLCDILIDVYVRISALINTPERVAVQPGLGEIFAKADARVRKVLVQGVVKEFEESTRLGVKGEVASVGKVVLGGLM